MQQLLSFDEKIIINNKRFNKNLNKVKNKNKIVIKNKKGSRSSISSVCGSGHMDEQVNIKNVFKVIYTNATSLNNKMAQLEIRIALENPDAIAISETWFNTNSCPNIKGYTLYRGDRVGLRKEGGVCIYVREIYEPFEVSGGDFGIADQTIETVWCGLKINDEKILIGCL